MPVLLLAGVLCAIPATDAANRALQQPARADSLLSEAYPAANAVDGDRTSLPSRWISGSGAYPHWIEIDLGQNYALENMQFWTGHTTGPYPLYDFALQYWNGTGWTDLYSETGSDNAGYVNATFGPTVSGNRVRLFVTDGLDSIVRLYEIELYGTVAPLGYSATYPERFGTVLDNTSDLVLTFSVPVILANPAGVRVEVIGGGTLSGIDVATDGSELRISHPGLVYDTSYAVHVPAGAVVRSDNPAAANGSVYWEFTVGAELPQLVEYANELPGLNDPLEFVFDRAVSAADVSGVALRRASDGTPVALGAISVSANTLTINHEGLLADEAYIAVIPAGAVTGVVNSQPNAVIRRSVFGGASRLFLGTFEEGEDGFTFARDRFGAPSTQLFNSAWRRSDGTSVGPDADTRFLRSRTNWMEDFFLSPPRSLKSTETYTLRFRHRNNRSLHVGYIPVASVAAADSVATVLSLLTPVATVASGGARTATIPFSPEVDDDYYVIVYSGSTNPNQDQEVDTVSLTRAIAPVVGFVSPEPGSRFLESDPVTVVAEAYGISRAVTQVRLFDDETLLGTMTQDGEFYTFAWNNHSPGERVLSVVATDALGNTASSELPVTVTFDDGTLPPYVEWDFESGAQGWTVHNMNFSGNRLNIGTNFNNNPWAASPVVFLTAGETYTLMLRARVTTTGNNLFNMRMLPTREPGVPPPGGRADICDREVEFTVGPQSGEWMTIERTFTVDEDGAWHINLYTHDTQPSLYVGVQMDDIRVIGNLNAAPQVTFVEPAADLTTIAGATYVLRVNATDQDGFVERVELRTAEGELLAPESIAYEEPWTYTWGDIAEGVYDIRAVAFDNQGGFESTPARRVTVAPNRFDISTYLGGPESDDAFTGVVYLSDGTLVVGAKIDPARFPGASPLYLNGTSPGHRGVIARLSGDGRTVLSVTVVGSSVLDLARDGSDRIYVAAGESGAVILSSDAQSVLWAQTYPKVAHRIDASPSGYFAVLTSTLSVANYLDERVGNVTYHVYDPSRSELFNAGGPAFTNDLAIDEVTETVALIGFKNITNMDYPPWSSQHGQSHPVDIPILNGVGFDGLLKWRGYDWERYADNPDRHLNAPTNNMADTRGARVTMGPDGHLYAAFEFDGGNTPLRYSPLDIMQPVAIVGGIDNHHNMANTGTLPKVFVGRYRIDTGEYLRGQHITNRLPNGNENTIRIKNGNLAVDAQGRVHLVGASAAGLPLSHDPLPGSNYTGGAWYLVYSPDFRSRELMTRLTLVGGSYAGVAVSEGGRIALAGFTPSPSMFTANAWQDELHTAADAHLAVGRLEGYFKFQTGEHPRLFFDAGELAEIRERLGREPFASMYQALRENVGQGDFYRLTVESNPRDRALRAMGHAYLYALSGDEAHAQAARDDWAFIFAEVDDAQWTSTSVAGLTLYGYAAHLAIAYDLCSTSDAWDAGFNYEASRRLVAVADVIVDHGGANQPNDHGSNWHAARGSTAGLAYLATDHAFSPTRLDASWKRVQNYLNTNAGNRPTQGWNPEGFGYTAYPFGMFLGPYGIAQRRADPSRDLTTNASMQRKARSGFIGATSAFNIYGTGGIKTDWSNDNGHIGGEGIYGQAFAYAPDSWLPPLRHAYDRLMGHLAPHGGNWDSVRHGSFWSILFYPEDVASQDPMEHWHWHVASDDAAGLGKFTFRDGYVDENDILVQFKTRNYNLSQANKGPDGLGFRVLGLGESFVIGGGRDNPGLKLGQATVYRTNPDADSFTANNNTGTVVGMPLIKPDGGGHAIGRMTLSNVTTANHKRWFVADFDAGATGAAATIIVADTSDDGVYWQLPTYLENTVTYSGNSFTITGVNGATLRGTILHPGGSPLITTGTKARGANYALRNGGTLAEVDPVSNPLINQNRYLHIQSNGDGAFLVVMTLQPDGLEHPAVSRLSGGVADAVVQVGGRTYTLHADNVLYDGAPYAAPAATVTFNVGSGGVITAGNAVHSVAYGGSPIEPTVVSNTGYTFLGWDRAFAPVVRDLTVNAVYATFGDEEPADFAGWMAGFPSVPQDQRDPLDNPAADGWNNLLKYAFGMDPSTVDYSRAPGAENDGDNLVLRYHVNETATDVSITPVFSVSLAEGSWNPVPPNDILHLGTDAQGIATYEAAVPLAEGPVFLRLDVRIKERDR